MKFDLKCTCGDFSTTEILVEAITERGAEWIRARVGQGAASFTAPKSALQRFFNMAEDDGLTFKLVGG